MATKAGESPKAQSETVQQVEEELAVGKREVATGGVRVTTSVSERPVEGKTGGGGLDGQRGQ